MGSSGFSIGLAALTLSLSLSWGATFVVSGTGSGSECSETNPCSLQEALNQAAGNGEPDTIQILPGVIRVTATFTISDNDGIIIQPFSGTKPIIDGDEDGTATTFRQIFIYTGSGSVTLRNIIFRNGRDSTADGGAVEITGSGINSVLIEGCEFLNNEGRNGGAVYINAPNADVIIQDSKFTNNQSKASPSTGGAVSVTAQTLTLRRNTFDSNSTQSKGAGDNGGSVYINVTGNVTIEKNIIKNNLAGNGGAIYGKGNTGGSKVTLVNNLIYGNSANFNGGGIYWKVGNGKIGLINNTVTMNGGDTTYPTDNGGGVYISLEGSNAEAIVYNNIIHGNNADTNGQEVYITESVVSLGTDVQNNLFSSTANAFYDRGNTTPPASNKRQDPAGFKDSGAEDFDLVSTSPAIDLGDDPTGTGFSLPSEDFEGTRRSIDGDGDGTGQIDAGAYEFGFEILVSKTGTGFATVVSTSPSSLIYCGNNCTNKFDKGIDVTLQVQDLVDTEFQGWGGDCAPCGTSTTCTLTSLSSNKTCSVQLAYVGSPSQEAQGCGGGGGGNEEQGCQSVWANQLLLMILLPLILTFRTLMRTLRKRIS